MFEPNALFPKAELSTPLILASKALAPTAVFLAPSVFDFNASYPTATLDPPDRDWETVH